MIYQKGHANKNKNISALRCHPSASDLGQVFLGRPSFLIRTWSSYTAYATYETAKTYTKGHSTNDSHKDKLLIHFIHVCM